MTFHTQTLIDKINVTLQSKQNSVKGETKGIYLSIHFEISGKSS